MAVEVKNIKFGIAPIGWRNDDIPEIGKNNTYKQIMSEAALAGYEGTEVGGCYPTNPDILNKELSLRNQKIISQWYSGYIIKDGIEKVKEDFEKLCIKLNKVHADAVVYSEQTYSIQGTDKNVYIEKPYFNDEEWDQLAEGVNTLGEIANSYNLKLAFHHHLGTGVQTLEEVDRLMENTNPSKVYLVYDTANILVSDNDYMTLLEKHIDRVGHVHFKDVRTKKVQEAKDKGLSFLDSFLHGVFTVPGDGAINFKEVYNLLIDKEYEGWIVVEAEQDPELANPLEYAIKAKNYIETLKVLK